MRVFVTGETGFIGSAVVEELIGHWHDVIGLARSDAAAATLTAAGAAPHHGSVEDPDSLRRGARQADAAIHTAYFHQFSHAGLATRLRVVLGGSPRRIVPRFLRATSASDRTAITTIGQALGTGRPFVSTFGTLALPAGRLATENDDIDPDGVGALRSDSQPVGPRAIPRRLERRRRRRPRRRALPARPAPPSGPSRTLPGAACAHLSCGCRPSSTATVTTTAFCRGSLATPASTASPATPATVATGGRLSTASTLPACSCRRWKTVRPAPAITASATKACRSKTSPPRSAGT